MILRALAQIAAIRRALVLAGWRSLLPRGAGSAPGRPTIGASPFSPPPPPPGKKGTKGPVTEAKQGGPDLRGGGGAAGTATVRVEARHVVDWVGSSGESSVLEFSSDDAIQEWRAQLLRTLENTWRPTVYMLRPPRRLYFFPVDRFLSATSPWGGPEHWRAARADLRGEHVLAVTVDGSPTEIALPGPCYAVPHEVLYSDAPLAGELERRGELNLHGSVAEDWETVIELAEGESFDPAADWYVWYQGLVAPSPRVVRPRDQGYVLHPLVGLYRCVSVEADYSGLGIDAIQDTISWLRG